MAHSHAGIFEAVDLVPDHLWLRKEFGMIEPKALDLPFPKIELPVLELLTEG